jgi:TonB-dependent starch-binding outer membrane protein SusC
MDMNQRATRVGERLRTSGRSPLRAGGGALLLLVGLLVASAVPAYAQHNITGRVTAAETGQPLPGVQVTVRGTSAGTLTNADGRYMLIAPTSQGTLVFSRIGYTQQVVPFDSEPQINVQMTARAMEIEGIVVVGYGERRRASITESIGTVSAEEIQRVSVASPDQAIQGRISGVQLTTQSGAPGAPTAVRIRGVGTIGNTQPLYVIDGVPVGRGQDPTNNPLATINPADIESISVLKDASAAAVYGVQAANGVVLITTRRGTMGKPTIRYDGYTGLQQMPRYLSLNNSQEWLALQQEAHVARNQYFGYQPGDPDYGQIPRRLRQQVWNDETGSWQPNPTYDARILQTNTDWQRVPLNNNAPIMNHNMSVSGATDQVNYFVSAGYFQQDAIQQRWDMNRVSFRANSDFRVNDRVRFGETFSLSNQFTLRGQHLQGDGRILDNAVRMAPILVYRCEDHVAPEYVASCLEDNRYGFASNLNLIEAPHANQPAINHLIDAEQRNTRVIGGLHGEVDVLPGLTFRSQGNLDYNISSYYQWTPGYRTNEVNLDRSQQAAERATGEDYGIVWTNTMTFANTFGQHSFNVLGGAELQQYRWQATNIQRSGAGEFLSEQEAFRRVLAGGRLHNHYAGENAFLGYMGRLNYNFGDRYIVTMSVRRDGASEFAPGHQWGTFPSFSAAWRIGNEPFFQNLNLDWINQLAFRGSWGRLGNSAIPGGAYPHLLQVIPSTTYTLNGTDWTGDVFMPMPRFPNPAVTWETTTTTDFGVETVLLNGALDLMATYYDRNTSGFLLSVDLPPSSGFRNSPFNSGNMTNRGFEFEAGYRLPRLFNELDLHITGNLTTVRNRLESLAAGLDAYSPAGLDGGQQQAASFYRTAPGHPVGFFYGFRTCGVFQTQAQADAWNAQHVDRVTNRAPQAGDLCFMDMNSRDADGNLVLGVPDGIINDDDRVNIGSSIPDGYFGLNLSGTFRRFDVSAFFNGVYGVQKYNAVRRVLESMDGGINNQLTTTRDRWTPENTNTSMPRAIAGDPAGNNRFSDRWVEDAGFFRLRSLQLGFTLPQGMLGTQNTRIYLTGQNLFTMTPYSGFDPEFTTTLDRWRNRNDLALFQGTDSGDIPQPRMFQIGVSTSF